MRSSGASRALGAIGVAAALALLLVPRTASAQSANAPAPVTGPLVPPLTPSDAPIDIARPAPSQSASTPDIPLVPLTVDVEGSVIVVSAAGRAACSGPCVLRVAPGYVQIQAAGSSVERHVDGPSRLRQSEGVPALRTAGLVTEPAASS